MNLALIPILRHRACKQQGKLCFYCARPMTKPTAEHLKARHEGGPDTAKNIVAACSYCNHRRHQDRRCRAMGVDTYRWFSLLEAEAGVIGPPDAG